MAHVTPQDVVGSGACGITHRKRLGLATLLASVVAIAGHVPAIASAASVAVPAAPAAVSRVVALAPHIVELVYAAGAGHLLVGVAQGSDFPPEAATLPIIGDGNRPNIESILAIRPDIVLGWQRAPLRSLEPVLAKQGITLAYSDPQRLQDIADDIARLGTRLGTSEAANKQAQDLRARLDALRSRYADAKPVRVFVQVGQDPLYSIGETNIISDALGLCGAVNVMGKTAMVAPRTSVEGVLATAPDAILSGTVRPQDSTDLRQFWLARGWPAHSEEIDRRLITLNADALYRPTPRMVTAVESLCAKLDALRPLAARPAP